MTIQKCFRKAQLDSDKAPVTNNNYYYADNKLPISVWITKFNMRENELRIDLDSYVSVDEEVETFQVLSDAEIIAEVHSTEAK